MAGLQLKARNTAPDSPNVIHTEEAQRYGFKGGIVPGITLYGYLIQPLVARYGQDWLSSGQMEVRFRQPVYDGEQLTLDVHDTGGDDGETLLSIVKEDGVVVVRGKARRSRDRDVDVESYPLIPADDAPLEAGTPERLGQLPDLKEWALDTDPETVRDFMDKLEVDDPLFRDVLHPAIVARVSAYIVGRRFTFGPRIHVGVRTRFLATAPVGSELTGRGRIVRVWEHNGNHYLQSDLLVVDRDGKAIMQIDSESLYQLGNGPHA